MWIVPTTHKLYSAYAPEYLGSKEALKEQFEPLQQIGIFHSGEAKRLTLSLMWKSKPLSLQTWLDKWKRAYWIPPLFGRMLKLSMHDHFVTKYTESLADIRASPLVTPESGAVLTMKDTFGRIYLNRLKSSDRSGFILKMSQGTLAWDMQKFDAAYQTLAIELRKESLLRRKSVRPIDESGSLFSELWKTPVSSDGEGGVLQIRDGADARTKLRDQAPHWTTPTSNANTGAHVPATGGAPNIQHQVTLWTTPVATDLNRNTKYKQGGTALSLQVKADFEGLRAWTTPSTRDYKDTRWDVSKALSEVQEIWQPSFNEEKNRALFFCACREYVMENNRTVHAEDLHRAIGNSVVEQTAELAFITLLNKHLSNG